MTIQLGNEQIALKEWAVTVQALLQGELIFVLRKGGIIEETRAFEVLSQQFYLMPAFEHQKEQLLKDAYRGRIAGTMKNWSPDQSYMELEGYASVVEDIEITTQEELDKLRELHIWQDQFTEERLKWKKKNPLHLLILRVYRLETPARPPMHPPYTGCKSWVRLEDRIEPQSMIPGLSDAEFQYKWQQIKNALQHS